MNHHDRPIAYITLICYNLLAYVAIWSRLKKGGIKICVSAVMRNQHAPFIELKQGAHSTYSVRKHSHDELSFGFVEGDSSNILCKTLRFRMEIDQTILLPPDTVHLCQPDDINQFIFKMIYIDPSWFSSAFHLDARSLKPQTAQLDENDVKMKDRFFASFPFFDNALIAESETLWFIGRLLFNTFDIHEPLLRPRENAPLVSKIKSYLDDHYTEPIRLDDLADFTGKSKFSFIRKFKAAYKLTPHAYLLNKRINLAKQYLLKGETNAQTAALCGFFDQSHFIKTFRQFVGMNPADYK